MIMGGIIEEIKYYTNKRFSTLAGTLVYFLLMSVTPFLFWLALIVGEIDLNGITSNEYLSAVAPVIEYLQRSAAGAAGSASLILILTSLWSSTNFFYHLRRSGEIIFESRVNRGGLRLRFSALLAVFATLILVIFAATVPILSYAVLKFIMPAVIADLIELVFITLTAFLVAYFLNVFACPYRLSFEKVFGGVLLTVTLWVLCAIGFSFYLRFADPQKLYGAIAAVIVFLLWCYLMVNSLVIGIIYNGKQVEAASVGAPLQNLL